MNIASIRRSLKSGWGLSVGRPSKLAPGQWAEIERRLTGGESQAALAKEFKVSRAVISERFSGVSEPVRKVAQQLAEAQSALATLPPAQQYNALSLAEKLRNISASYASAAELGAKTGHRLHALANSEVGKVDDADPLSPDSLEAMKGIALLTKLGNDALVPASNLLAANKAAIEKITAPSPTEEALVPLRPQVSREEWLKLHGPS